jgi:hypothetical protein
MKAVLGQDGTNVAVELQRLLGSLTKCACRDQCEEREANRNSK